MSALVDVPLNRRIGACRTVIETYELTAEQRCEVLAVAIWPGVGAKGAELHRRARQSERDAAVAMTLAGHSVHEVAERYHVSPDTVGNWVRRARGERPSAP